VKWSEISLQWSLLDAIDCGDEVTWNGESQRTGNLYWCTVVFDTDRGSTTEIVRTSLSLPLVIWSEERATSLSVKEWATPYRAFYFISITHHTHTTLFFSPYYGLPCRVVRKFHVSGASSDSANNSL
jgi:hypothetical protein